MGVNMVEYSNFSNLDIRVGEITEVSDFPDAHIPSYKLVVYFGNELGSKKSSAHITNYKKDELIHKKVIGIVNFPPKQVGHFISEVLILGVVTDSRVKLLTADGIEDIEVGSKIA